MPLNQYIKHRLELLKQFGILVSGEQKEKMKGLKSEIAVDQYYRDLLNPPIRKEDRRYGVWCGNI
jgi:hypothetical protein